MTRLSRRNLARYATDQLVAQNDVTQLARDIFSVLADDGRTGELELLMADIYYELEDHGQVANTRITSAVDLSDQLMAEVKALVKKTTGVDQVLLNPKIDKSVVGGLRIETATKVWDRTVANQLNDLKGAF